MDIFNKPINNNISTSQINKDTYLEETNENNDFIVYHKKKKNKYVDKDFDNDNILSIDNEDGKEGIADLHQLVKSIKELYIFLDENYFKESTLFFFIIYYKLYKNNCSNCKICY